MASVKLRGLVFSGKGEGAYYVMIPNYLKHFRALLGSDPYPGTLNIKLSDRESIEARRKLEKLNGYLIEGFRLGDVRYGAVKCFKAIINGHVKGLVLVIEKTRYGPDVIEVVSPQYLRGVLNLKDGDPVEVEVLLD
ncbi:MAG: hypothetical protein DRN15_02995 [Thermoprotei archaeon]|nr:MAG: hypothetical protein DRM97_04160 [Thermoprotei archaeon]RLF24369.1 MAG: hypothetical protein DRN15_02995 [Thermoprotei archaeon]